MRTKGKNGQAIIETLVGLVVLVPLCLFLLDVGCLVLGQSANDGLAKHAARAAANKTNAVDAQTAAQAVVDAFGTSGIIIAKSLVAGNFNFDPVAGQVTVQTQVTVILPIVIPFLPGSVQFQAQQTEPVVALPPTGGAAAAAS